MLENDQKKPKVISLFSGCGGLDKGLIDAEFEIAWANDFNKDAVMSYQKNIGNHIVLGDISKIDSRHIPNDCDLLVGGFPCQGFSIANSNRQEQDPRNFLYKELLRIVQDKQPKFFMAENVKGLLSMGNGRVLTMILNDFKSLGYAVDYKVIKASDYGIPQHRERVIIMGNRIGLKNIFPTPTTPNAEQKISVKDAIGFLHDIRTQDLPFFLNDQMIYNHVANTNVSDTFLKRKHDVSQSEICEYLKFWRKKQKISTHQIDQILGYKHTAGHWLRNDRYGSIPTPSDWWELKKILNFDDQFDAQVTEMEIKKITFEQTLRINNWDTPSDTITASNPEIHPNLKRRLSVRECAILQSFPMNFEFVGSISSMYRQIGNAVPPKLAYFLGMEIKKQLESQANQDK